MKYVLTLGSLLLAAVTTAHAATTDPTFCTYVAAPKQLTPYENAKATLVSLWYARNAAQRGTEFDQERKKENYDTFQLLTAMMRTNKIATNDFICAKRSIEPFTLGNDIIINTAAKFLTSVYVAHIDLNQRLLDLLKNIGSTKQVELMDQMSSLEVERGQRFSDLVKPTTLALMLLIDGKRTDDPKKTTRLIITKAQKQELVNWANKNFVEFTNGTPESQWTDPAKTAHLFFDVFKDRKCSDE
jgi:hypothetical protein